MKIWLRLHGFEPCSWTFVWQNLKNAFENMGIQVYGFEEPDDPEECLEIWWGDPQFWRWSDKPVMGRIAIALSEARSILAEGRQRVIKNLQMADLILCPSQSAATAFREAPIDVPIRVVLFGVDVDEFHYVDRDWMGDLRFLHGGVTQFRKGSWLVPEAFVKAFDESDHVQLSMYTWKVSPMYTQLSMEYGRHRKINFSSDLEPSAMDFYKVHDVYISPHLSEGFGLMIPEAMATGMPCLVARCSAPREYFERDYGWWIEMSEMYGPVEATLPHTNGFWRVPDVGSLADVMREAYENRDLCKQKGDAASSFIRKKMTWHQTCLGILSFIKERFHGEKSFSDNECIQRGAVSSSGLEEYRAAC